MSGVSCPSSVSSAMPKDLRPKGYNQHQASKRGTCSCFQMPLHYPRYRKSDYETMPEWRLDCLLKEYGLPAFGDANQKRKFAMGAFLWPSENE